MGWLLENQEGRVSHIHLPGNHRCRPRRQGWRSPASEDRSCGKDTEVTDGSSRPEGSGCFGRYFNEMQIAIDWPLVSTAVFAGGVECNPPGMEPGGSENAAALWISKGGRGPGRGPGQEWTSGSLLPQSGPALLPTPYSHRKGPRETHPDALKGGGGWGWGDMQSLPGECRKGVGAGEEKDGAAVSLSTPHLLAASAGLQPAPSPLGTAAPCNPVP
ncbi:PREDICTED: putative uncharacterized protein RUSC1-AS1 [Cercocebus atys]|nr:PREDICTED: putative uncharacterized protein RUSC1-AS1 [Cercocebus atys]